MARQPARHQVHRTRYWVGGPPGRTALIGAGLLVDKADQLAVRGRTWAQWWSLVLITEGGGTYADGLGRRRRVKAGDIICTFPGLAHTYYRRGYAKWSECHVIFQGDIVAQMEKDGLLDRRRPVWRLGLRSRAANLLRKLVADCLKAPVCRHARAIARIHQVLAEAQAEREAWQRRGGSPLVRKARLLLAKNLNERRSMTGIARTLGVRYDTFRKIFRAETGLAPNQYRLRCRVEAAQSLLRTQPRSVKAIACQLGFCNPYFFSAQFKRLTGLSPTLFREQAQAASAQTAAPTALRRMVPVEAPGAQSVLQKARAAGHSASPPRPSSAFFAPPR
jgi:AraC-like DNA-binding protein